VMVRACKQLEEKEDFEGVMNMIEKLPVICAEYSFPQFRDLLDQSKFPHSNGKLQKARDIIFRERPLLTE